MRGVAFKKIFFTSPKEVLEARFTSPLGVRKSCVSNVLRILVGAGLGRPAVRKLFFDLACVIFLAVEMWDRAIFNRANSARTPTTKGQRVHEIIAPLIAGAYSTKRHILAMIHMADYRVTWQVRTLSELSLLPMLPLRRH
jgi:hypothetical protein